MFNKITVIGCGLIGSSVLRRLKKNKSAKKVVSYDNSKSVSEIVKKENLSDQLAANLSEAVKNSDFILIATPLSSFENIINSIKDSFSLRQTALINKIPYYTTLQGAKAAALAIKSIKSTHLKIKSLQSYFE